MVPCKNIEHKHERRTVFNIGVETDETYTANGIVVHNCQSFSVAGKRKGANDNRYLWPHMLKAIHEIRSDWVENVAGILTMVQPDQKTEAESQSSLFGESDPIFERRSNMSLKPFVVIFPLVIHRYNFLSCSHKMCYYIERPILLKGTKSVALSICPYIMIKLSYIFI